MSVFLAVTLYMFKCKRRLRGVFDEVPRNGLVLVPSRYLLYLAQILHCPSC